MMNEDFKNRLQRLEQTKASPQHALSIGSTRAVRHRQINSHSRWSWPRAIYGALLSAFVFALFVNMQAISDLAPTTIKESDMPGLFGAPVAVISFAWMIGVPFLWVRGVFADVAAGRNVFVNRPIMSGAFLAQAACLGAMVAV
ncbi:MAG: hypothetical protein AAFZ99_11725 [Pseudomonadota bacterium]